MIAVVAYDRHMERLHAALTKAEVEYRIVGGMAVFFQMSERDPDAARLTRDVDVAIDRRDLQRIARAAEDFGFRCRVRKYYCVRKVGQPIVAAAGFRSALVEVEDSGSSASRLKGGCRQDCLPRRAA